MIPDACAHALKRHDEKHFFLKAGRAAAENRAEDEARFLRFALNFRKRTAWVSIMLVPEVLSTNMNRK